METGQSGSECLNRKRKKSRKRKERKERMRNKKTDQPIPSSWMSPPFLFNRLII
jgi:hypothetical protein